MAEKVQMSKCVNRLGTARIQLQEAPGGQIPLLEAGSHLKPYSSVVQFYNFVNSLGTARIQVQEAPGDQIPFLEAGSHLKPYSQFSCSILQLCKPLGNR